MTQKQLQGFQVLQVKFAENSKSCHHLFIKEHSVRIESRNRPKGRTLFVLNIPPWATKEALKKEFNKIAPVTKIYVQDKPSVQNETETDNQNESQLFPNNSFKSGFRVGYIVFQKSIHLLKVLDENINRTLILSREETPITTGIKKWTDNYYNSLPNRDQLQKEIDAFMNRFDARNFISCPDLEQYFCIRYLFRLSNSRYQYEMRMIQKYCSRFDAEEERSKETNENPDDDGWITVTKKGRKPGLVRKESVTKKIRNKDKIAKKKKQLLNFYTFQIRESKMKHLASLRERFAEDKKKIENMKNSRKFKPF